MISAAYADEFEGGGAEFDQPLPPNYTEAEIQRKIAQEMTVACKGNMCKIAGTDSSGSGWTVSFNVGYGAQSGYGGWNNGGPNGTGVIVIGNPGTASHNPSYSAGINVTYRNFECESRLMVTPAIYRFVQTYMYNMVNTDGSVKRNFSPADQTVILFYTTMLNKVEACKSGV